MEVLSTICQALTDALLEEMEHPEKADTEEVGAVIDMIKDLMDAKKNEAKAKYYCTVVEAMEGATPEQIRSMFK